MRRMLLLMLGCVAHMAPAGGRTISGIARDAQTREELVGAMVYVLGNTGIGTTTALDGTFTLHNVPQADTTTLVCQYIGYQTHFLEANAEHIVFSMEAAGISLTEVNVTADLLKNTEVSARMSERAAPAVLNVVSAGAIETSPDVTVANVIQRVSGVTIERNSSGEGQYAILRGMDKRYNYTLVNGVKISSPDNKNRFVPLDMFPSDMLDRLEVSKSLTADMEGDGIGGAVNLVMKNAPSQRQFAIGLSTGYNAMYIGRKFQSFNYKERIATSPYERMGQPAAGYKASMADFPTNSMRMYWKTPLPDLQANLSYGDRFFRDKFGLMLGGSFSRNARGKETLIYYQPGTSHNGIEHRNYSTRQTRAGLHAKMDYRISPTHKLSWYNGYLDMTEAQVRDGQDDAERAVRMKWTNQRILNSTLAGEHAFLPDETLRLEWSASASKARSQTPDNTEVFLSGSHVATSKAAVRRWEHNSDGDISGYAKLSYQLALTGRDALRLSAGGMLRSKKRDSFFNEYTFNSATGTADPQIIGEDWNNFDEIQLVLRNAYGNVGDPLNYDATEQIGAGYGMMKYTRGKLEMTAGLRVEHTAQGYVLKFPRDADPEGMQKYTDLLPDFHIKYEVHRNANLRFSYARAINRPGFFEIVPYSIINEDYKEKGNPDLQHTVADNLDLRYEFFPEASEQIMLGLFYKHLQNPIEYGLITEGQDTYFMPMNFGNARNFGLEADVVKYFFGIFGIKANYTYTHSRMTTDKRLMDGSEVTNVPQERPLAGQAAHVANLSLLLKNAKHGWDGQVAGSYVGKRLCEISNWYDDDIWEAGFFRLDISVEKRFKNGLALFAKGSNLLDTPVLRYIRQGPHTENVNSERFKGNVIERVERHGQSVMLGVKYKL